MHVDRANRTVAGRQCPLRYMMRFTDVYTTTPATRAPQAKGADTVAHLHEFVAADQSIDSTDAHTHESWPSIPALS